MAGAAESEERRRGAPVFSWRTAGHVEPEGALDVLRVGTAMQGMQDYSQNSQTYVDTVEAGGGW
jgi:hypothetical protein